MRKNRKGFTLIEIIVVVVILAVLMAVAVPSVLKYLNEADNAKYMTLSRAINDEVNIYVTKELVDSKSKDFATTIAKLKSDLSLGTANKLNSIVSTKPLSGEMIYSIDCDFDGKIGAENRGWGYDKSLGNQDHTLTKITITYRKINSKGPMTDDSKFVVTLINKKMYYYDASTVSDALDKEEGPAWAR